MSFYFNLQDSPEPVFHGRSKCNEYINEYLNIMSTHNFFFFNEDVLLFPKLISIDCPDLPLKDF